MMKLSGLVHVVALLAAALAYQLWVPVAGGQTISPDQAISIGEVLRAL